MRTHGRRNGSWTICALALVTAAACGGGGGGNNPGGGGGGSPLAPSTGAPGPSGATITITASGVSPSQVTISTGQSVTFINNDTRAHDIQSNPHPSHGQCPSISGVGQIGPGQTQLTNGFGGTGTCGFHDHGEPGNAALQGRIVIQ